MHHAPGCLPRVNYELCAEAKERLPAELGLSTTPGRVFKRFAELKKLCRRGMRSYRFYLFNDMILYCKYGIISAAFGMFWLIVVGALSCCVGAFFVTVIEPG